ncbi:hypothetical protein ACQUY5_33435, partial [Bacillus cereus]
MAIHQAIKTCRTQRKKSKQALDETVEKEQLTRMEQLLVLTYGDKIYKCTLHPNEQSIVSIGKEWTN